MREEELVSIFESLLKPDDISEVYGLVVRTRKLVRELDLLLQVAEYRLYDIMKGRMNEDKSKL